MQQWSSIVNNLSANAERRNKVNNYRLRFEKKQKRFVLLENARGTLNETKNRLLVSSRSLRRVSTYPHVLVFVFFVLHARVTWRMPAVTAMENIFLLRVRTSETATLAATSLRCD